MYEPTVCQALCWVMTLKVMVPAFVELAFQWEIQTLQWL